MNLIRQFAIAARDIKRRGAATELDDLQRKLQIANKEDFYLRATKEGYYWGKCSDPDNLLPTKHGK